MKEGTGEQREREREKYVEDERGSVKLTERRGREREREWKCEESDSL